MDSLKLKYREIIEKVLKDYADFLGNDENIKIELVFDQERVGLCPAAGIAICWWKLVGKMAIVFMELCYI
jgi:hypothetical protein